jgi:hypothetical protein
VKFVNTSMHGVSDPFVARAFAAYGLAPYVPVVEQQHPDADCAWAHSQTHKAGVAERAPQSRRCRSRTRRRKVRAGGAWGVCVLTGRRRAGERARTTAVPAALTPGEDLAIATATREGAASAPVLFARLVRT